MDAQSLKNRDVTVNCYGGVQKPMVVVEDLGDVLLVCSREELLTSRAENREPIAVGFRREDVAITVHKKTAHSESMAFGDRSSKAGD